MNISLNNSQKSPTHCSFFKVSALQPARDLGSNSGSDPTKGWVVSRQERQPPHTQIIHVKLRGINNNFSRPQSTPHISNAYLSYET